MSPKTPICLDCKYFKKNNLDRMSCDAFLNIPDSIIFGENKHETQLYNQGNSIVFKPLIKNN